MVAIVMAAIATIPGTAILPVQAANVDGDEDQNDDGDNNNQDGPNQGDEDNNEDN